MLTAVILICSLVLPSSASYNSSLDTSADIAFLVSLDDGTVIFDKNADKKAAPASLTKIAVLLRLTQGNGQLYCRTQGRRRNLGKESFILYARKECQ